MGGVIDRVKGLSVGKSTTLELLVSELLDGAITDITEPHGETMVYLRRTYLPPAGTDPVVWPWQKKLEELLMEDNGFFRIEVCPGHSKHFIDEGTHRLPFYLFEMVPQSKGVLKDIKLDTEVAMVAPRNFGMRSVSRAAGKPQALFFRFLPVLMMKVCSQLSSQGYEVYEDGSLDRPIEEISYEFIDQLFVYLKNQENLRLDKGELDESDKRTPSWVASLPWKYRDELQAGLNEIATRLVRSTSGNSKPQRLKELSARFSEPLRELFLAAVTTKLDQVNYNAILLHRDEPSAKSRLISLLNVAAKREVFERFIDGMQDTLQQVSHLPISTLQGYNEIIVMMEKGAKASGCDLNSLLNRLGGRSYGVAKESYGPVHDSYVEMPADLAEPGRTEIIAHLLDEIYGLKMRNRGELRRETIRKVRAAWTEGPIDRKGFREYLSTRSLEDVFAYLPLSRYLPASEMETFYRRFVMLMEKEKKEFTSNERLEMITAIATETSARYRQGEEEEEEPGGEYGPVGRSKRRGVNSKASRKKAINVGEHIIPLEQRIEVLGESIPDTVPAFEQIGRAAKARSDDDEPANLTGEPSRHTGHSNNTRVPTGSGILLPRFGSDYFHVRKVDRIVPILKVMQIAACNPDLNCSIAKLYGNLDNNAIVRKELIPRMAVNALPDWDCLIFPNDCQMGIATLEDTDASRDGKSGYLELLARFSGTPLALEPNMIMPEIWGDVDKYPYQRLWIVSLESPHGGMPAEVVMVNALHPLLDEPRGSKCLLDSRCALGTFYKWARQVDLFEGYHTS